MFVSKNLLNQSSTSSSVVYTNELYLDGVDIKTLIANGGGGGTDYSKEDTLKIGLNAGKNNQKQFAIAIGSQAGNGDQATESIAIGHHAGSNSQQFAGIAIGSNAGSIGQGQYGIAIGQQAGYDNQGYSSVAIGDWCGWKDQNTHSVAVGMYCGETSQGESSVAIGNSAGKDRQGNSTVAIGKATGTLTQGENSIAIGVEAGHSGQGVSSIAIGSKAGHINQHANTIVLNASGLELNTEQANSLYIAPIRSIGSNVSSSFLSYNPVSKEVKYAPNINMTGTVTASKFYSPSDLRLKKNVRPFPNKVLDKLMRIEPVTYRWKSDDTFDYGFIAQQFYKEMDFLKEAHDYEDEDFPKDSSGYDVYYGIEYQKITTILCKAIQELNAKVESLEKRIST